VVKRCPQCGTKIPDESVPFQTIGQDGDAEGSLAKGSKEIIYTSTFECPGCGARLRPDENVPHYYVFVRD
jgi:hypothetical protein